MKRSDSQWTTRRYPSRFALSSCATCHHPWRGRTWWLHLVSLSCMPIGPLPTRRLRFYNFLKANDLPPREGETLPPGHWYDGSWTNWKGEQWRVHNFYVPVNNQRVSRPRRGSAAQIELADQLEESQDHEGRFRVWGMTGRVLVDAARIAYNEEPEMTHNLDFGRAEAC
jgi:hypothetical protein